MMTTEAQRSFWCHWQTAQQHIRDLTQILPNLKEDLCAMSRALKGEPTLIAGQLPYIRNRLSELAEYADEIDRAVRQKRQDGEEADRRIDAMIGSAS